MTKIILRVWMVCAVLSMLLYAFAGIAFWSPMQGAQDSVRALILIVFHVIGVSASLIYEVAE